MEVKPLLMYVRANRWHQSPAAWQSVADAHVQTQGSVLAVKMATVLEQYTTDEQTSLVCVCVFLF
jgi:hypothetical protein